MGYKTERRFYSILPYFFATIWLINGLLCKLLNLVPRHQLIVARILGHEYSGVLTKAIGVAEIGMAIWILLRIKTKLNAVIQIALILIMNVLEFMLVPDLLLWGKLNLFYAIILIAIIYYHEFVLQHKLIEQQ
jgi:hypothetical protein